MPDASLKKGAKFDWSSEQLEEVEGRITRLTARVVPQKSLSIIKVDESDNRILECAEAAGSDVIVSGDNHILSLGKLGNIRIMRVADFLSLAQNSESLLP